MTLWSLIDQPQSLTYGGEGSAEQKSEASVETRENDVPNAFQEFEEGMKQHQPSSGVSIKEGTLQTREKSPVVTGYAVTVYKAQGLTLEEGVVINFTRRKRMRSREKVEHEDQKQDDEEEDDKDANETLKERCKEVTGNVIRRRSA